MWPSILRTLQDLKPWSTVVYLDLFSECPYQGQQIHLIEEAPTAIKHWQHRLRWTTSTDSPDFRVTSNPDWWHLMDSDDLEQLGFGESLKGRRDWRANSEPVTIQQEIAAHISAHGSDTLGFSTVRERQSSYYMLFRYISTCFLPWIVLADLTWSYSIDVCSLAPRR